MLLTELLNNGRNRNGHIVEDGSNAAAAATLEDVHALHGSSKSGGGRAEGDGGDNGEGLEGEHLETSVLIKRVCRLGCCWR